MYSRMATIIAQGLILVLFVDISSCIHNHNSERQPHTTTGHGHHRAIQEKGMKHNGLLDTTLNARCESFIVDFQKLIRKIKKQRTLKRYTDDDRPMGGSNLVDSYEIKSKYKRFLDHSVYLQCQRYIREFRKAATKFNVKVQTNVKRNREVPQPVASKSMAPSESRLKHWSEEKRMRRPYSFIQNVQQRMFRMIDAQDLDITHGNVTTSQKVLYYARKNILAIALLVFMVYLVFDVFWSNWCRIIRELAWENKTLTVRKPRHSAAIPLLPTVMSAQDQKQWKHRPPSEDDFMVSNGQRDDQKRKVDVARLMVPFAKYQRHITLTSTERTPVREETESKAKEASLTNIPGFEATTKSEYKRTNYFQKAYKDYTPTYVDYFSLDKKWSKSEPVESCASTTPELDLHQLPYELSVSEFDTLL